MLTLFMILFLFSVGTVSAATIQVPAGSSNVQIQALIDGASSGDTINFETGTYNDIKLVINKTLNLVGNGAIINSINVENTTIFKFTAINDADASGSTIQGFEFFVLNSSASKSTGYAIQLDKVSNVGIRNITSHNGKAGVYCGNSFNDTIENCTFTDSYLKGYALNIMGGSNITLRNSTISGAMDGVSIASGATNVYVDGNKFLNNDFGAFFGGGISYITFINNLFDGFNEGLGIEKAANLTSVINNTFINGKGDAIYIKNSNAHGPYSVISDIEIIGNVFANITNGAAIGIDKDGIFHAVGTGDSIKGINNTVTNVSNGYVALYSKGQNLNFTLDSSLEQPVTKSNVSISSAISSPVIKNGDKVTYTVTVKNTGNGNAANVKISDILKTNYYSSYAIYTSAGTYSNGNWNIGNLGAGDTASLVITATAIKSGVTTSQATVTADNNTTATSNVLQSTINKDIKLNYFNSISSSRVKTGKYVYLTTKVSNSGKDISGISKVKISLPKGMKLVTMSYPSAYNKKTNTWTFTVPAGKAYSFTIKAKMTSKGPKKVIFYTNGKTQIKYIKGY